MTRGTQPAARDALCLLRCDFRAQAPCGSAASGVACVVICTRICTSVERAIHRRIEISLRSMLKPEPPRHPRDISLKLGPLHPSIYPDIGIHTRACVQAVLERLVNDAARRIDETNAQHEATAAEAASALAAESARAERAESEIAVLQANPTSPPLLLLFPPCRTSVLLTEEESTKRESAKRAVRAACIGGSNAHCRCRSRSARSGRSADR